MRWIEASYDYLHSAVGDHKSVPASRLEYYKSSGHRDCASMSMLLIVFFGFGLLGGAIDKANILLYFPVALSAALVLLLNCSVD